MTMLGDNISDFFFPNRCGFCGCFIPWRSLLCRECSEKAVSMDFCGKCGKNPCECSTPRSYDGCAVLYPYIGAIRRGIISLKYFRSFNAAKFIVPELSTEIRSRGIPASLITAVPMTRKRRRSTGYNQSEYIAKLLSKSLGIPRDFRLIEKKRGTGAQHLLSAEERMLSAKSSYFARKNHADISGSSVILCDDIITTGSTLDACAAVLKSEGASAVYCAVLASTVNNPRYD